MLHPIDLEAYRLSHPALAAELDGARAEAAALRDLLDDCARALEAHHARAHVLAMQSARPGSCPLCDRGGILARIDRALAAPAILTADDPLAPGGPPMANTTHTAGTATAQAGTTPAEQKAVNAARKSWARAQAKHHESFDAIVEMIAPALGREAAGNLSPCDLDAALLCLSSGADVRAALPWLFPAPGRGRPNAECGMRNEE